MERGVGREGRSVLGLRVKSFTLTVRDEGPHRAVVLMPAVHGPLLDHTAATMARDEEVVAYFVRGSLPFDLRRQRSSVDGSFVTHGRSHPRRRRQTACS